MLISTVLACKLDVSSAQGEPFTLQHAVGELHVRQARGRGHVKYQCIIIFTFSPELFTNKPNSKEIVEMLVDAKNKTDGNSCN